MQANGEVTPHHQLPTGATCSCGRSPCNTPQLTPATPLGPLRSVLQNSRVQTGWCHAHPNAAPNPSGHPRFPPGPRTSSLFMGCCTMPDSSWLPTMPPLLLTTGPLHRWFLCLHPTSWHRAPLASNSCCFVSDESLSSPNGSSRFRIAGAASTLSLAPRRAQHVHRRSKHGLTWLHVTRGAVRLGHPDVERPRGNTGSLSAVWRYTPRVRLKPRSNHNSCCLSQRADGRRGCQGLGQPSSG